MKPSIFSLLGGLFALASGLLGFLQILSPQLAYSLSLAGGALAIVAVMITFAVAKPVSAPTPAPTPENKAPAPVLPPAPPTAREEEALLLLSLLQEKGRFVDFLMDDISAYTDQQVGAAARIVQQGCRAVITQAFAPIPVAATPENAPIVLPADAPRETYKLVGTIPSGQEIRGRLLHKGWKPTRSELPRRTRALADGELPVIAPAEVQL